MNLPLFTAVVKQRLVEVLTVELVFPPGALRGGPGGQAGLRPLRRAPQVTGGGERAPAGGGGGLAERGGGGAAGADGVRPRIF